MVVGRVERWRLVAFASERRLGDICNPSHVQNHAQLRADIECLPQLDSLYSRMQFASCDSGVRSYAPVEAGTLPLRLRLNALRNNSDQGVLLP